MYLFAVALVLSGMAKAVMDASSEGALPWNPEFWDKNKSWKRKWKNGDPAQGEAFWGSSRWFVFVTDGWHLSQFFCFNALLALPFLYQPLMAPVWDFLAVAVIHKALFEVAYSTLKGK